MFKLSKKTEYGLIALQHMMTMKDPCVATVKEIAERHHIPRPLLAKICQQLAKSKLIQSVQGSRGGYTLKKDAAQISLAAVMEALEGPIHIVDCHDGRNICDRDEICTLKFGLNPVEEKLTAFLQGVTLAAVTPNIHGENV
ncbi:Rrf2 family transcriptional regulator [candidate division KSB1 bacterium]|nr:Rrf2 family transcriptional regulator [candidate division KSB1 bacterium]RQW03338.1 MAG: Rrf2 family transcriptional regulator [candidate division KSB1 bacterium]